MKGKCYRVTFNLDGRGLVYNPSEPLHLDGLIQSAAMTIYGARGKNYQRDSQINEADELPIPVPTVTVNGSLVFCASALFPVGTVAIDERQVVKRFDADEAARLGMSSTVNHSNGFCRLYNIPVQTSLVHAMAGWVFTNDLKSVKRFLQKLTFLGKYGRMGYGGIVSVDMQEDDRNPIEHDGVAMRWYPHPKGLRRIRPRPPYWNATGLVQCLAPGDKIP